MTLLPGASSLLAASLAVVLATPPEPAAPPLVSKDNPPVSTEITTLPTTKRPPSDFRLRLLPGWTIQPEEGAVRLFAQADDKNPATLYRLETDCLTIATKEAGPRQRDEAAAQVKAHLETYLRDVAEREGERQVFAAPNATGIAFRFQATRRADGKAVGNLLAYALIGDGGRRTALLAPIDPAGPLSSARVADLDAQMRTLSFLPAASLSEDGTAQFAGKLLRGDNNFHLWLRGQGDAEAVWDTRTPLGDPMTARFAGCYAFVGDRLRVTLIRMGGDNRYVSRLMELEMRSRGGTVQGTARFDNVQQVPTDELHLLSLGVLAGRTIHAAPPTKP